MKNHSSDSFATHETDWLSWLEPLCFDDIPLRDVVNRITDFLGLSGPAPRRNRLGRLCVASVGYSRDNSDPSCVTISLSGGRQIRLVPKTGTAAESLRLFGFVASLAVRAAARRQTLVEETLSDPLTGLLNRRGWRDYIQRLPAMGGLVLFFDVNGLKAVNETLGYEEGDRVLRRLGGILRQSFRAQDGVCRWGGDEFIVYLSGSTEGTARLRIKKINDRLRLEAGVEVAYGSAARLAGDDHARQATRVAQRRMLAQKQRRLGRPVRRPRACLG
jgi:diguanylate cyclase (GGDEF)-like protein